MCSSALQPSRLPRTAPHAAQSWCPPQEPRRCCTCSSCGTPVQWQVPVGPAASYPMTSSSAAGWGLPRLQAAPHDSGMLLMSAEHCVPLLACLSPLSPISARGGFHQCTGGRQAESLPVPYGAQSPSGLPSSCTLPCRIRPFDHLNMMHRSWLLLKAHNHFNQASSNSFSF